MVKMPSFDDDTTVSRIYKTYEEEQRVSIPRPHLGASEIGKDCERAIWYNFRWIQEAKFSGRMLKLFERGKREEEILVNRISAAGVEIYPFNIQTGRQYTFSLFGGHFGGSLDAIGRGFVEAPSAWHLIEFKTHNDKSFNSLVKKFVREAKPEHFFQMQAYMGMSHEPGAEELTGVPKLERAFYFAVNKNDDEIYSERLHYDPKIYAQLKQKALRIILQQTPPPACAGGVMTCKFCDFAGVCNKDVENPVIPRKTCRSCCHVTAKEDGKWICELRDGKELPVDEQVRGCGKHLYLPYLLPWKPVDSDTAGNTITYEKEDGTRVINKGGGRFDPA